MKIINNDITEETEGLIIHGVNCQGVMGTGVALAIRNKWPIAYIDYKSACTEYRKSKVLLGKLQVSRIDDNLYIGNGFTQEYYGRDDKIYADLRAVDLVLHKAFMWCYLNEMPLKSVQIGCGLGGLLWDIEVKPLFQKYEAQFKTEAQIYHI